MEFYWWYAKIKLPNLTKRMYNVQYMHECIQCFGKFLTQWLKQKWNQFQSSKVDSFVICFLSSGYELWPCLNSRDEKNEKMWVYACWLKKALVSVVRVLPVIVNMIISFINSVMIPLPIRDIRELKWHNHRWYFMHRKNSEKVCYLMN